MNGGEVVDAWVAEVGTAFLDTQNKLDDFGNWIEAQPGVGGSGYLSQINHPENGSVELLWHGHDGLLTKVLAEAKARGIPVTVVPRSFNAKQAEAAAAAILSHKGKLGKQGVKINTVTEITPDVDAVVVSAEFSGALVLPDNEPAVSPAAEQVDAARQAVADEESVAVGLPVALVEGEAMVDTSSRSTDTSPFYAGGLMKAPTGNPKQPYGFCSSGFAVKYMGNVHTTTVHHCVPTGNEVYTARDGTGTYGSTILNDYNSGISVLTGGGSGYTFDGGWDAATNYLKGVTGVYNVKVGDYLCTSGGNSGVHCNIKVTAVGAYTSDQSGWTFKTIKGVQQTSGAIAAAVGGGPAFVPYSDLKNVGAVGLMQGSDPNSQVSCTSTHNGPEWCSNTIYVSPIGTFLSDSGATLVTGVR